MSIMNNIQKDVKAIAADAATVGATVGALIAIFVNAAPSIHIPAGVTATLVGVSSAVAAVVAEARRIAGSKKSAAVKVAQVAAIADTVVAKKVPAKKAPAKRVAGK